VTIRDTWIRKVVAIDDVGEEHVRSGYLNYVLHHLEWRLDNKMPFIFATRLSIDQFSEYSLKFTVRIQKQIIKIILLGD
jgi:hypothetical protein